MAKAAPSNPKHVQWVSVALVFSLALHGFILGGLWLLSGRGTNPNASKKNLQTFAVQLLEVPDKPLLKGKLSIPALLAPLSPVINTALPPPKLSPTHVKALPPDPYALLPYQPEQKKAAAPETFEGGWAPDLSSASSATDTPSAQKKSTPQRNFLTRLRQQVEKKTKAPSTDPQTQSVQTQQDGQARKKSKRGVLALRIFTNRVREQIKQNYGFPGEFSPNLRTIVQVVVGRDGSKQHIQLVHSSGNARFDRLVCLNRIRDAKFPPIPADVQKDSVRLTLTCRP